MKDKIRYTCSGYKYAPESFKCYMVVINPDGNNHSYYFINEFTDEENWNIGNICITKGKLAAEAEIKRLLRSKQKFHDYITYGYKEIEGSNVAYLQYEYIHDSSNILKKLELYKKIKNYFKSQNYIASQFTLDTCELDSNYNPIHHEKKRIEHILNPTPLKIKFV